MDSNSQPKYVKVGDQAPDFSLPMHPEGSFTLNEQLGKTIVLYFYPMDDTPGCTKQACGLRDLSAQFAGLNAAIYGVSADSLDSHALFAEKYSLPFPLLTDQDGKLRALFGNPDGSEQLLARITYIIDSDGVVRHIVGPDATVDDHVEQSLAWALKLAEAKAAGGSGGAPDSP